MKLLSVNVSHPREVAHGRKTVRTGIFKEPVASRVVLRELKLDGDGQADLVNHGGLHRAVYVYPVENYDHWGRELGRDDLSFGQFGENFTRAERRGCALVEDRKYSQERGPQGTRDVDPYIESGLNSPRFKDL
jgi:MOSC domain-containing protein YiiM